MQNGNGLLCRVEFDEVNRRLGVGWDKTTAWQACLEIQTLQDLDKAMRCKVREANMDDDMGSGAAVDDVLGLAHNAQNPEISFRAFVSVYNQIMGTHRRRQRQHIKTTFEDMMQSPRGLHRSEIQRLVKRVEKRLLLLPPRFAIDDDWKLMLELSGIHAGIGRLDSGGLTRSVSTAAEAAARTAKASADERQAPPDAVAGSDEKHCTRARTPTFLSSFEILG